MLTVFALLVLLHSFFWQDGYMVSSGDPTRVYLDSAVRHVMLRQGVLGIKVGNGVEQADAVRVWLPSWWWWAVVEGVLTCLSLVVRNVQLTRRQDNLHLHATV
jgi:hypothetical protein